MNFYVLTLFPEFMESFFQTSIIRKGYEKKAFNYQVKYIRDEAVNKYGQVDDAPYGGGAGMLLRPEPVINAYESLFKENGSLSGQSDSKRVVYFSPKGKKIDHQYIIDLTKVENIVLLCGHYEGVDQRVIDLIVDDELSVGDFVLTGGELPAMMLMDAVIRQLDGVIKSDSLKDESFSAGLLEHRQYTRPSVYRGLSVPDVLISGNHKEIEKYKKIDSIRETMKYRPDLIESLEDKENISSIINTIKRELNDVSSKNS